MKRIFYIGAYLFVKSTHNLLSPDGNISILEEEGMQALVCDDGMAYFFSKDGFQICSIVDNNVVVNITPDTIKSANKNFSEIFEPLIDFAKNLGYETSLLFGAINFIDTYSAQPNEE